MASTHQILSHTMRRPRPGVAMVAVLWVIALLMLIVVATVKFTRFDSDVATRTIHSSQARHLAEMGLAIASHPRIDRADPLLTAVHPELDGSYETRISSEASRLNINAMLFTEDRELLRDLFQSWGLELDEANRLIDALLDWIDSDDSIRLNGAEFTYYENIGQKNLPYNRAFYSLDELKLVRGWNRVEELNPKWKDDLTVFSYGKILIPETSPEILALATGATPERCTEFLNSLKGMDMILGTKDDVKVTNVEQALTSLGISSVRQKEIQHRFTTSDSSIRIESIGRVGNLNPVQGEEESPSYALKITLILSNKNNPSILDRQEQIIP